MAAYPSLASVPRETSIRPATRRRFDYADDGTVRGRSLGEEDAYEITVTHPVITAAELATLRAFYDTNKDVDNTIDGPDGEDYDVNFQSDYTVRQISATRFTVSGRMIGNRQ